MKFKSFFFLQLILIGFINSSIAQTAVSFKFSVLVSPQMKQQFVKGGRLLFHLTTTNDKEPRSSSQVTIGVTPTDWDGANRFTIDSKKKNVLINGADKLKNHLGEKYFCQVVYKQNITDGNENVEGNFYSNIDSFTLTNNIKNCRFFIDEELVFLNSLWTNLAF
jgi:hypothetical protein